MAAAVTTSASDVQLGGVLTINPVTISGANTAMLVFVSTVREELLTAPTYNAVAVDGLFDGLIGDRGQVSVFGILAPTSGLSLTCTFDTKRNVGSSLLAVPLSGVWQGSGGPNPLGEAFPQIRYNHPAVTATTSSLDMIPFGNSGLVVDVCAADVSTVTDDGGPSTVLKALAISELGGTSSQETGTNPVNVTMNISAATTIGHMAITVRDAAGEGAGAIALHRRRMVGY